MDAPQCSFIGVHTRLYFFFLWSILSVAAIQCVAEGLNLITGRCINALLTGRSLLTRLKSMGGEGKGREGKGRGAVGKASSAQGVCCIKTVNGYAS